LHTPRQISRIMVIPIPIPITIQRSPDLGTRPAPTQDALTPHCKNNNSEVIKVQSPQNAQWNVTNSNNHLCSFRKFRTITEMDLIIQPIYLSKPLYNIISVSIL